MPNVYIKVTSNSHCLGKKRLVTLLKIELGLFPPTEIESCSCFLPSVRLKYRLVLS